MEIVLNILKFAIGLGILILSSDFLIESSVRLASLFRLTPLFIGSILIGFGTSAPEAGIGIIAAFKDRTEIALGNVIGSNITNIGLVLGLCSFLRALDVERSFFKREFPFLLFSIFLLYFLSLDSVLGILDGIIFLGCLLIFLFFSYLRSKNEYKEKEDIELKRFFKNLNSKWLVSLIFLFSLLGVIWGANLMINSGVKLAKSFNINTWVIAVSAFAIGTSLPELATSLSATFKRVHSISVGNIVGSNIFNILFILGIASLITPIKVELSTLKFEFFWLFIFTLSLFLPQITHKKITRIQGLFLFLFYINFLVFLFFK